MQLIMLYIRKMTSVVKRQCTRAASAFQGASKNTGSWPMFADAVYFENQCRYSSSKLLGRNQPLCDYECMIVR